ncbi:hypothetical protein VXJ24_04000 [Olsenella sp. YH-ols2221]|uniref:hypothetical protein n=1 Tax=Olsenella kribbiana TaxID=3115221 RepID=UPI002ED8DB4E
MISEDEYEELLFSTLQTGTAYMLDNGDETNITSIMLKNDNLPVWAGYGIVTMKATGFNMKDIPEGATGTYYISSMMSDAGNVSVITCAFGIENGHHCSWAIAPGMERPQLLEDGKGLESTLLDMPERVPTEMTLAAYVSIAAMTEVLKSGFQSFAEAGNSNR